jgi:hypothetical protein
MLRKMVFVSAEEALEGLSNEVADAVPESSYVSSHPSVLPGKNCALVLSGSFSKHHGRTNKMIQEMNRSWNTT